MLWVIVQDARKNNRLANIRIPTVYLLAFAGFFRHDELANIQPCDRQLSRDGVRIRFPRSKTNQYRQRNEVFIARTTSDTCPVAMLEEYIRSAEMDLKSQLFLFRQIARSRSDELPKSGCLTYMRLREPC